jgi:hypothetical protein
MVSIMLTIQAWLGGFSNMAAGILTAADVKLGLYKERTADISPNITMGDLIECDYGGYTAGGVVIAAWSSPVIMADGSVGIESTPATVFAPTDGVSPQSAKGYFLFNTDTDELLRVEDFPAPVPMLNTLSRCTVTARISFDPETPDGTAGVVA